MSEIETTSTELATTTPGTPAVETPTLETTSRPETMQASIETNPAQLSEGAAPPVIYNPNYKFKVMDKELEVPDFLRGVIKDSETEKKIIDILQKAEGLPIAKERLRGERDDFRNKFQTISSQVMRASQTYQRGDIDGFFDLLKIPHERILQWAVDKVSYSQLPVEQRQVHDQSLQAQRRAHELEEKTEHMEQQIQEQVTRAKQAQMDLEFAKPEVKSIMTQYDAVVGTPGAFMAEVVKQGQLAWHQRKEDISPEQAVQEVLRVYGKFLNRAQSTPTVAPATIAAPTPGEANQQKPNIIPNLQGKASSPIRKGPRSLEDLRKLAREASAS